MENVSRMQSPQQCNRAGFGMNRKWLFGFAAVALIVGIGFNWSWLVAAGVAPLLVGILPCAAMCALHLCSKKSGAVDPGQADQQQRRGADPVAADR